MATKWQDFWWQRFWGGSAHSCKLAAFSISAFVTASNLFLAAAFEPQTEPVDVWHVIKVSVPFLWKVPNCVGLTELMHF